MILAGAEVESGKKGLANVWQTLASVVCSARAPCRRRYTRNARADSLPSRRHMSARRFAGVLEDIPLPNVVEQSSRMLW